MIGKPINTDGFRTGSRLFLPLIQCLGRGITLNVTPEGKNSSFVRHVYSPLDKKQSCVLIHYMGDHKTTVEFPHGNCKSNDKQFVRTCPSVINAAKQSVDLPSNVYRQLASQSSHSSNLHPVIAQ